MDQTSGPILAVIPNRKTEIAGLPIGRSLPSRHRRSVGPWVFFDHMGPHDFPAGKGIDVPPHPHIHLTTVTYLFEGELTHRDTLGNEQVIQPGAVNLMVAGRGIAHSERTGHSARKTGHRAHGLQLWCALPEEEEGRPPSFTHYPARSIPDGTEGDAHIRVLIGAVSDLRSPVETLSPTLYAEVQLSAGAVWRLPGEVEELAIYPLEGKLTVENGLDAQPGLTPGSLVVIRSETLIRASADARFVLIGGAPLGKRFMWWNFVSSRPENIEGAKEDWREGRFGRISGDDGAPVPLPGEDRHGYMK